MSNWDTLLDLLAGDQDLTGPLPPDLQTLAEEAGVLHLVAGRAGGLRSLQPQIANLARSMAVMGVLHLRDYQQVAGALTTAGIPVVVLKGMAYALMFQKGGPTKAMADVDLLVPDERFDEAAVVMNDLGFKSRPYSAMEVAHGYHERAFWCENRLVELHRAFIPGRRIRVDYPALWARTIPLGEEGAGGRRLGPEDTLLYHCLHMGIHEFSLGGLRAVCELRQLLEHDGADLVVAARRAVEWATQRHTWCALRLLERCFPGTLASRDLARFAPPQPMAAVLERLIVQPSVPLLRKPVLLPRPIQLFRKALLVDSLSTALSYLAWYLRVLHNNR